MVFHNNVRFPDLYNLDLQFQRIRSTEPVTTLSGDIYPNPRWIYTRRRGRMSWGPKTLDGIQEFINFFEAVGAMRDTWRIRDPQDYNSSLPGQPIDDEDQLIATGDGVVDQVQLSKNYVYQGISHSQPIYAPVSGTVVLAIDGVAITEGVDWSIDYETGIITLTNPLANGANLTAGYEYDLKCRLETDTINQEYLVQTFAKITTFTIVENPL